MTTNPYATPSAIRNPASPRLRSVVVCGAYFSLGMFLPLIAIGQAILSGYPRGLLDASTCIQFAWAMSIPLMLVGVSVAFFAAYTMARVRCYRILIGLIPLLTASVLFPFGAWIAFFLDYAITGNDSGNILKLPAMLVVTGFLAEIFIVRWHSGCGVPKRVTIA